MSTVHTGRAASARGGEEEEEIDRDREHHRGDTTKHRTFVERTMSSVYRSSAESVYTGHKTDRFY